MGQQVTNTPYRNYVTRPTTTPKKDPQLLKTTRHINNSPSSSDPSALLANQTDYCNDKLCFGLPKDCLNSENGSPTIYSDCSAIVTSKTIVDPARPSKREILFELIGKSPSDGDSYVAVGFSESGKMEGLVSECVYSDRRGDKLKVITVRHSFNVPGRYNNIPVTVKSGIKNLGVSAEDGSFHCRWIVESSVEFSYEDDGELVTTQADLAYKNFHILLARGPIVNEQKSIHFERSASLTPVSLAQIGSLKSLGSHFLLKVHGSLMITIWVGLVTISIVLARYYKNEWANSKVNNLSIWFILHRTFMLIAWFVTIIAIIFAYLYTETYHPVSLLKSYLDELYI